MDNILDNNQKSNCLRQISHEKSLTLYDDIKCITVNGQTIIYVEADLICHVTIIQFAQKIFGKP